MSTRGIKRSISEDEQDGATQPDKIRVNGLTWTKNPDYYFKDGSLTLLADDHAYRVHASVLTLQSLYWKEELGDYDVDQLEPKELEDILAHELDAFLSVVYASDLETYGLAAVGEWTSVLRLASLWNSQGIRSLAIDVLDRSMSSHQRLVIARAHDIQDWIEPAFESLSTREEPLSVEEAKELPIEDVIRITTAREKGRAPARVADEPQELAPVPVEVPPLPKITSRFTQEELQKVSECLPKQRFADVLDMVTTKKLPAFYHALEDFTNVYSGEQGNNPLVLSIFQHTVAHPVFIPRAIKILSFVARRVPTHGGSIWGSVADHVQHKVEVARGVWTRMDDATAKYADFDMALRSAVSKRDSSYFSYVFGYPVNKRPTSREEYEERSANLRRFIEALSADDVCLAH